MKTIKIKYPYFVFAINPLQDGKIVSHRMVSTPDVPRLFKLAHPRCNFVVVHGTCLLQKHFDYLETFKIS